MQEEKLRLLTEPCIKNPLRFVQTFYDWGVGELKGETGPDDWQTQVLEEIRHDLEHGGENPIRIAVRSGHGIGKTALVAWVIQWFIWCRSNPQVVVTASTQSQLLNKTWRELAKWQKLCVVGKLFKWTATKYARIGHEDTWFASAIPWSEGNADAFAGTHERNVLVLYDEASAISDKIWEVTEGAMTTPGAMWLAFGNPTKNTGRFKECFGRYRHRWHTIRVDSRTAKKANKAQLDQWIEDYGLDSDFVRVRVLGEFPHAATNQFISSEDVENCFKYEAIGYKHLPQVLGVDVARYGDDQTVFTLRQGRKVHFQEKFRELDTMQVAMKAAEFIDLYKPDSTVVDETGVGAGVLDWLRMNRYPVRGCNAGSKSPNDKYLNMRAYMWGQMRDAIHEGIDLPQDDDLKEALTGTEYGFSPSQKVQLEKKEDMKKRGLASPDEGDSLALTYAFPVHPKAREARKAPRAKGDYIFT